MARLFEQGGDVTPELNRRVAWGDAGVPTKNSTWQTIVTFLQGALTFLRPSNNLSDLTDAATARANLGITDPDLSAYALKNNVLALDNTVEYLPSAPYNPATAIYVANYFNARIKWGSIDAGDIPAGGRSFSVSWPFGTDNYNVLVSITSKGKMLDDNNMRIPVVYGKTSTGFNVLLEETEGCDQNLSIEWMAIINVP